MRFPESLSASCLSFEDVPLAPLTTVGIGGNASLVLEPRDRGEMVAAFSILLKEKIPFRILGGGSNLLVSDRGVGEVVVSLRRLARLYWVDEGSCRLGMEAGVTLPRFVSSCHKFRMVGAEGLIGIPGTVGGAAVMNAGGCHGSIGTLVQQVLLINDSGELEDRVLQSRDFGYRTSILRGRIVVEVVVELQQGKAGDIWDRMTAYLQEKKNTQPLRWRSCGCVFKNPSGDSAGRLLDRAGMKGVAAGNARVSEQHANFILNEGGCTFREYASLITEGKRRVFEQFGIKLDLEIDLWMPEGDPYKSNFNLS